MNLEYLKECRKKKFKNQTSAAEHIGYPLTSIVLLKWEEEREL